MNRRDFLKTALGSGLAASGALLDSPLNLRVRAANGAPQAPALVTIFQRGGCDGLNTVVPYGDANYYSLRPTIGIAEPNAADPAAALDLDGFFGLHPSMASLHPFFNEGRMAVLPSVQYPNPSRSHFDSQYYIESGMRGQELDGWLNRHLASSQLDSQLRAVHMGGELAQSLRGMVPVTSFSSIDRFNLGLGEEEQSELIGRMLPVYEQAPNPPSLLRQLVQSFGLELFNTLDVAARVDPNSYVPANGANYPNSGLGRALRQVAQLLKDPTIELEVATADQGGYDTHSSQGGGEPDGRHARALADFADSIAALVTDLGPLMDQVVILTMTEFGRTCQENGSRGTDHGIASSWFVVGNRIAGGQVINRGGWPGLAEEQMLSGRFLDYTVDHRDIMGDIVAGHLGNGNLDLVLPGHSYQPVGLFG